MKFIYLFDPLCGWCYAASRGIQALAKTHQVDVFATGLFANTGRIMDAAFAHHAWTNDTRIAQITGLPFSEEKYRHGILLQGGEFNSFNLSMACFLLNEHLPSAEWLPMFSQLQKMRYVDGLDSSQIDVVKNGLTALGKNDLAARVGDDDVAEKTKAWIYQGQVFAQQFCINGVPSLIAEMDGEFVNVPSQFLYQDVENVDKNIAAFLA